jgi:hypothetical protein
MIDPIEHNQPAYFYMMQYENLACPARFERATYALEEFVAVQKCIYFNGLDA